MFSVTLRFLQEIGILMASVLIAQSFILLRMNLSLSVLCFPTLDIQEIFFSYNLSQMLLDDGVFSFDLDICFSNQKQFCAIQSRKNGGMFFKSYNNSSQVFVVFIEIMMRLYLNPVSELYGNLFKFVIPDFAYSTHRFDKALNISFKHAFNLMSTFTQSANIDIFRTIYHDFLSLKDYEIMSLRECNFIVNNINLKLSIIKNEDVKYIYLFHLKSRI